MSRKNSVDRVVDKINPYVDSHCPIVYLETYEEDKADQVIDAVFKKRKIWEWNLASGWVDFHNKTVLDETNDLAKALSWFNSSEQLRKPLAIVLKDSHYFLREPRVIAAIKSLVMRGLTDEDIELTLVIVSSRREIPRELENFVALFELPLPKKEEILDKIQEAREAQEGSSPQKAVSMEALDSLAESLLGLTDHQITQLLQRIAVVDRMGQIVSDKGKELVLEEKSQIILKSGNLELVPTEKRLDDSDLGGFRSLKTWLQKKKKVMDRLSEAEKLKIDLPKGIILAGMPGCGKSLCAKVIAQEFSLPLLRLDVGRLHGKYVGESEENMRRALKLAEDIAPCVLWIDELEKAFSGVKPGGSSSDVTTRLFGYFLTWLQDRGKAVFVVATANDLTPLPSELQRKGRFDENFLVDFPDAAEREEILKIHLRKRSQKPPEDLSVIARGMKTGYSGADIESVVSVALEQMFVEGRKVVTGADLRIAIKSIKSFAESMPKKVEEYRKTFGEWNLQPVA